MIQLLLSKLLPYRMPNLLPTMLVAQGMITDGPVTGLDNAYQRKDHHQNKYSHLRPRLWHWQNDHKASKK